MCEVFRETIGNKAVEKKLPPTFAYFVCTVTLTMAKCGPNQIGVRPNSAPVHMDLSVYIFFFVL